MGRSTPETATARVARRLLDGVGELTAVMGGAYRAEVPEYAALDDDEMARQVLPVSRALVETFFQAVVAGREPHASEVPGLPGMGRRRLEMGVPLEPMLHVYRIAGRRVWDAIVAATGPGEERVLGDVGGRWMDFIDRAASLAAADYLEASHQRLREIDAHRRVIVEALLAASGPSDVAALAAEYGTSFAPSYVPVVFSAPSPARGLEGVLRASPAGTLCGYRGTRMVLLVPGEQADPEAVRAEVGGGAAARGHPAPPGHPLAAELAEAARLLEVALACGRTGCVGPGDLLVERMIAADERSARAILRAVVDPLTRNDRSGQLASTLRAYLACGSVPETARREVVHQNTVAYRLRRVGEITGFDPRVPADATVLALGILAARLHPPTPDPGAL